MKYTKETRPIDITPPSLYVIWAAGTPDGPFSGQSGCLAENGRRLFFRFLARNIWFFGQIIRRYGFFRICGIWRIWNLSLGTWLFYRILLIARIFTQIIWFLRFRRLFWFFYGRPDFLSFIYFSFIYWGL